MSDLTKKLSGYKVVPVIVIDKPEDILPLGDILVENGLPVAEITFRSAAAEGAIKKLRDAHPQMLIGAGTVLDETQVVAAKNAGVDFIVSPGINTRTIEACIKHDVEIIPGVSRPSDIELALNYGIQLVKFFPAEAAGGIPMLKALLGPYSMLKVMPTGGISEKNIRDYLALEPVAACGGSWMVDKKLINAGDWNTINTLVKDVVKLIKPD
ncbi:bifunctional 4-hydroxy-2-oxoglutarate aldolase/2-dehydro-3-deoxy-phosphogluconate aldolase [Vibrio sp. JC009]|uniref:bifunctional 4-hydroxy-2-oxoglutarate aldolase/2-dehydro-3-deoxy-phosphogluconate aldolase n=1 Tax=Vibrio sp. JC009 TaxID=2912314 RepID=UPI0023AEA520|nr:bifunctional 4-hydroxy-2-oxoglutarate aldolase/2-dehydro-3-deoxy-phosphogluconate aldolase [Vibrio sp. JC009]WED24241.1 bifunctional 4-hydroxy-2-oxoglutarate aldolase/2-dehydro-3-deoxy-phosphogluconate aldolase [Vibrio sp. JC009]